MPRSHLLVVPLLAVALVLPEPARPADPADRMGAVLAVRIELQQQLSAWLTSSLAAPAEPWRVVAAAQLELRGSVRETLRQEEQPGSEVKLSSARSVKLPGLGVVDGTSDAPGSPNIQFKIPGRKINQVTRSLETAVERMTLRLFVDPRMPADRRELLRKVAGELAGADTARGDVIEVQELAPPPPGAASVERAIPWVAIALCVTALLCAVIVAIGLARSGAARASGAAGGDPDRDEILLGEPLRDEAPAASPGAPVTLPGGHRPFPGLAGATPAELAELLGDVEPVAAAVVLDLVGFDADTTRRLFERLPQERQLEIGLTLGTGRTLLRPALHAMETAVDAALAKVRSRVAVGGPARLADLLAQAPAASQLGLLDAIAARNAPLAEAVRSRMVFFGDLAGLDDVSVRRVITSVNPATVALALHGAPAPLREVVIGAASRRLRAILEAELEVLLDRPASEIEEARKVIEAVMHRLQQRSELVARAA